MIDSLKKVISGFQTGVDQIGVVTAKELGYETGGTAAPNFLTESGNNIYAYKYGIVEITKKQQKGMTGKQIYLPRTELNVIDSTGTVYYTSSPKDTFGGLKTTLDYCVKHGKPYIVNPPADRLRQWIINNDIEVLNIAGNRASKLTASQMNNIKELIKQALS